MQDGYKINNTDYGEGPEPNMESMTLLVQTQRTSSIGHKMPGTRKLKLPHLNHFGGIIRNSFTFHNQAAASPMKYLSV